MTMGELYTKDEVATAADTGCFHLSLRKYRMAGLQLMSMLLTFFGVGSMF
jgi:hypothetical protein